MWLITQRKLSQQKQSWNQWSWENEQNQHSYCKICAQEFKEKYELNEETMEDIFKNNQMELLSNEKYNIWNEM